MRKVCVDNGGMGQRNAHDSAWHSEVDNGGEACLSIRKHDHFTPVREIRRDIRALEPITAPKDGIILLNATHSRSHYLTGLGCACSRRKYSAPAPPRQVSENFGSSLILSRVLGSEIRSTRPDVRSMNKLIASSILTKCAGSTKITSHLDHISHCKITLVIVWH